MPSGAEMRSYFEKIKSYFVVSLTLFVFDIDNGVLTEDISNITVVNIKENNGTIKIQPWVMLTEDVTQSEGTI